MSYVRDGKVYIGADDATYNTTSSSDYSLVHWGDTAMIVTKRTISTSTDTGNPGELCFGVDSGTLYLYYCTATNTWVRSAFSSW